MKAGFLEKLLPSGVFLALALAGLAHPGMHNDEGFFGLVSRTVLARESAIELRSFVNYYAVIWGRVFPVMAEYYDGAVLAYLVRPFLSLFGDGIAALRLGPVLVSAAAVFLFRDLCASWFGRRTGLIAAVLFASNFLFVLSSRTALSSTEAVEVSLMIAAFWCLSRFGAGSRAAWAAGAAFLLGLGLSMKLQFLWYLGPAAVCLWVFRADLGLKRLGLRGAAACAAAFVAGAWLLILYNLAQDAPTARLVLGAFSGPTRVGGVPKGGVDNFAYFSNLAARLMQALRFLGGELPAARDWGILSPPPLAFLKAPALAAAGASLAATAFSAASGRGLDGPRRRRAAFFLLFYALVFLQMPLTLSSLSQAHLLMILPLPALALAYGAALLEETPGRFARTRRFAAGAGVGLLFLFQSSSLVHGDFQMRRNGGSGRWSSAVYEAADYLKTKGISSPVIFGLGLRENTIFLTGGEVRPILCQGLGKSEFEAAYRRASRKGPIRLLRGGAEGESICFDRFAFRARVEKKEIRLEREFLNSGGKPVYALYKVRPEQGAGE